MFEKITRSIATKAVTDNLDGLIRFAFFRLGDMAKAEDAVQEAILRILDNPPSLFKAGNLKAYLYRTVLNLCQDSFREDIRHAKVPIEAIEEREDAPDDALDADEARRISGLLCNIPDKEAEVIRMNVIDELSFAEISRIMRLPVSTVKYRYRCGMEKMRNQYFNAKQP